MTIEMKVPEVGGGVTEVQVSCWLVKEGDRIVFDEPIVELETDKVSRVLFAPASGLLVKILFNPGQVAKVGQTIAHVEENLD